MVGNERADDAGVFQLNETTALIHTVDFFTPVVDDPYLYGQIAVANSLSDVYAMGGRPLTALNILGFHQGKVTNETVHKILKGGMDKAAEAECPIAGGHSIQDEELKYGLAVTGLVHPKQIWRNHTVWPGDVLLLTKPLGTGAISTAIKQGKAAEKDVREIVASMRLLNRRPVEVLRSGKFEVHAATDISGFGLAGHLLEMLSEKKLNAELFLNDLPVFKNALHYLNEYAFLPGGFYNNRLFTEKRVQTSAAIDAQKYNILFDPQTSGGLLIAMQKKEALRFIKRLNDSGYPYPAVVIGQLLKGEGKIKIAEF